MRKANLCWVFSRIGSPSVLRVRRDERQSVDQQCKQPILGWLEFGSDRGSNDEKLLSIGLPNWFFNLKAQLHFQALKRNGFLATKQLQSLDSFGGPFVIKSKKKQVAIKIITLP